VYIRISLAVTQRLKTKKMNYKLIRKIITSYENQLLNAEIEKDTKKIQWLKQQINEGHKALATATGYCKG